MNSNINEILNSIAEDLDLSDTNFNKIRTSYEAVANVLKIDERLMKCGNFTIFPQGSVALGTVVRPLNDEFDVDMVFLIENKTIDMKHLKQSVGNALKNNKTYADKIDKEGKRCWTIQYDGYHMDILPARVAMEPIPYKGINSIEATEFNKISKVYSPIWRKTNPKGYLKWFLEQCNRTLAEDSKRFSIEKVEEYPRKTTLQKTVQLMKRHRDLFFLTKTTKEQDDKPISIIITTLAAEKYNGEKTVLEAIINISRKIQNEVDFVGVTKILNPVNCEENFADRWATNPNKKSMFELWIKQLESDMVYLSRCNFEEQGLFLKKIFGEEPVKRVYENYGHKAKELREQGSLKVDKKTGVLNTTTGAVVTAHTFYGKEKDN